MSPRASTSASAATGDAAVQVTALLRDLERGDEHAFEKLLPVVYDELRGAARRALAREHALNTLQATELVHEAFFKLGGGTGISWQSRAHFFAVAARAMRQVLVEHARKRDASKRGGGAVHVTLGDADASMDVPSSELIALDDALTRLGELDPRLRSVVEYRYFAGLTDREIAAISGVTERTVQRDWAKARAWLHKEIYPSGGAG